MAFIIFDIIKVNSISSKTMPIGMIMQSHSTPNMDASRGNLGINWSENEGIIIRGVNFDSIHRKAAHRIG